jgi:hypothetical protein
MGKRCILSRSKDSKMKIITTTAIVAKEKEIQCGAKSRQQSALQNIIQVTIDIPTTPKISTQSTLKNKKQLNKKPFN